MPLIDIAVIGAGPAGLHAATELSQRGLQVVVLEEHGDVGENVLCTGIIGAQAFQEFSLPQETIVGSLRQTCAHGRYGTEVVYAPAQPLASIVDKAAFNRALAGRAAAAGVEIRAHSRAVGIQTGTQQVSIAVRERAGRQYTLRARLAVLARRGAGSLTEEPLRPGPALGFSDLAIHAAHDGMERGGTGRAMRMHLYTLARMRNVTLSPHFSQLFRIKDKELLSNAIIIICIKIPRIRELLGELLRQFRQERIW